MTLKVNNSSKIIFMLGFQRHENYFKDSIRIKRLRNADLTEDHLKTIRKYFCNFFLNICSMNNL